MAVTKVERKARNAGARIDREAVRREIRKRIRVQRERGNYFATSALESLLAWVLARPVRTAKRRGGLGR